MLYTAAGGATRYGIVALNYTCNIEVSRSTKVHATTKFIVDDVTPMQFRPPIALRTDLSHITTELWEIPVLRMAH